MDKIIRHPNITLNKTTLYEHCHSNMSNENFIFCRTGNKIFNNISVISWQMQISWREQLTLSTVMSLTLVVVWYTAEVKLTIKFICERLHCFVSLNQLPKVLSHPALV